MHVHMKGFISRCAAYVVEALTSDIYFIRAEKEWSLTSDRTASNPSFEQLFQDLCSAAKRFQQRADRGDSSHVDNPDIQPQVDEQGSHCPPPAILVFLSAAYI